MWLNEKYPTDAPVKKSYYRHIFSTEFNISFCPPQKDTCDVCSEYEKCTDVSESLEQKYRQHVADKSLTYVKRREDKEINDASKIVLTVDMEQIFQLSKLREKTSFYLHKISAYNFTGVVQNSNEVYCILWSEDQIGHGASQVASAILKMVREILKQVINKVDVIIWMDNCISQNK